MNIYIIIFLVIVLVWIFLVFKFSKKKWISENDRTFFIKQLKKISSNNSYKEQIIDLDKLYHKILQAFWYKWSFWEILKQKPIVIWNLNKIWELHKLRNKLVHDFDILSENILKEKSLNYQKEIVKILRK